MTPLWRPENLEKGDNAEPKVESDSGLDQSKSQENDDLPVGAELDDGGAAGSDEHEEAEEGEDDPGHHGPACPPLGSHHHQEDGADSVDQVHADGHDEKDKHDVPQVFQLLLVLLLGELIFISC